ncbi:unnamed protein product [Ostreobium quekettii]|uniref:Flagellar biosynthesis protein FlhF n=1 Tax=Ostreobium quekettii TaxID=121088 RepID=A0A8S1IJP6_9CHLO|nr:unnamed protein product [Ostreobium quekettii]
MSIKTYRAKNMRDALDLIRADLGPDAAVLHTRDVRRGLLGRFLQGKMIEVAASATVHVPSRFAEPSFTAEQAADAHEACPTPDAASPPLHDADYRARYREAVRLQSSPELDDLGARVKQLYSDAGAPESRDMPDACFRAFTDMIEAGIDETTCRQLLEQARRGIPESHAHDYQELRKSIEQLIAGELSATGGIQLTEGSRRVVALVGPTGVGKTTTIAKLAANFRLREHRRVGLVTVDTYRVAAVEQLRTYADIIDLPMEVVSTPREMREAIARLADLDLVLVDTAGRSPRDEVKIQELKSMLGEAQPDEVCLVLSSTSGERNLSVTTEKFAPAGVTSMIYTKLDEATSLGHLLPVTRTHGLPVSYLTDGQNVPDDIQDQAVALRELVRAARIAAGQPVEGPTPGSDDSRGRLVVVAGSKGGVGVTTATLLLARAMAARGEPTLVIDANLRQADLAHVAQASIDGRHDLADVLSGVCRTADARTQLEPNLSLVAGAWAPAAQPDANAEAVRRWLQDLDGVTAAGENVVLDVGVGMKPWTEPLWRRATQAVLVSTPDKLAVLDAYAVTKLARGEGVDTAIGLLVNRVDDLATAQSVHRRVDETCRRFLGAPMPLVGWSPNDPRLAADARAASLRQAQVWTQKLLSRPAADRAA